MANEMPLGIVDLESIIDRICDDNVISSLIVQNSPRGSKKAIPLPLCSKLPQKSTLAVKHLNSVIVLVANDDISAGIGGNSPGCAELAIALTL